MISKITTKLNIPVKLFLQYNKKLRGISCYLGSENRNFVGNPTKTGVSWILLAKKLVQAFLLMEKNNFCCTKFEEIR